MPPTRFQRLFTDNRPLYFLMAAGAMGVLVWTGSILIPVMTLSLWSITKFVLLMTVAACLGAVVGAFPGGMILAFPLHWVEWRNGAPFKEGDEVVILSKRFPGRVARVYAIWSERHEVRVDLGSEDRRKCTDVFSYADVCRGSAGEMASG